MVVTDCIAVYINRSYSPGDANGIPIEYIVSWPHKVYTQTASWSVVHFCRVYLCAQQRHSARSNRPHPCYACDVTIIVTLDLRTFDVSAKILAGCRGAVSKGQGWIRELQDTKFSREYHLINVFQTFKIFSYTCGLLCDFAFSGRTLIASDLRESTAVNTIS